MEKTMRAINCVVAMLILSGCNYVYRKADVYEQEVKFLESTTTETAVTLSEMVKKFCVCTNGQWQTPVCADAEVKAAFLAQRIPYHTGMMLYLADLLEKQPEDPKDDLVMECGGDE
jgi:hypothetical protein